MVGTMRTVFLIGIVLAGFVSFGCSEDRAAATPSEARPSPPSPVPFVPIPPAVSRDVPGEDALIATGPLVVEHQLDLVAQRDGIIVKIYADTGQHLATGEPLLQLDDRQLRSELEATRAKTRSIEADIQSRQAEQKMLQTDYDRAKKLTDAELVPKDQLDHARSKVEAAEWEIRRISELLANSRQTERGLELELEKTQLSAPFAGVVARRYVREAQTIVKGDRLFWFTSEEPLRLRFTVPEKYLSRLRLNAILPLTSPNFPNERHTARLIEISPIVDPASGTVEAMVELVGSPGSLRTGMTADLRLENLK